MKSFTALVMCVCLTILASAQNKEDDRLKQSYDVLKEILGMPDKGIPRDLLNKAECVVVFPSVKKAAFIVGASYGRGVIVCRTIRPQTLETGHATSPRRPIPQT